MGINSGGLAKHLNLPQITLSENIKLVVYSVFTRHTVSSNIKDGTFQKSLIR